MMTILAVVLMIGFLAMAKLEIIARKECDQLKSDLRESQADCEHLQKVNESTEKQFEEMKDRCCKQQEAIRAYGEQVDSLQSKLQTINGLSDCSRRIEKQKPEISFTG